MLMRQAKVDAVAVVRCEHMRSAEGVTLRRCGEVPMRMWGGPYENARSPALQLMHELGELVAPLGWGARVLAGLPHGVCRDGAEGAKRASQRGLEG